MGTTPLLITLLLRGKPLESLLARLESLRAGQVQLTFGKAASDHPKELPPKTDTNPPGAPELPPGPSQPAVLPHEEPKQLPESTTNPSPTHEFDAAQQPLVLQPRVPATAFNLYWLGHDIMWTIDVLIRGAPRAEIIHGIRAALGHLRALGLPERKFETMLTTMANYVEREIVDAQMTATRRNDLSRDLSDIRVGLGAYIDALTRQSTVARFFDITVRGEEAAIQSFVARIARLPIAGKFAQEVIEPTHQRIAFSTTAEVSQQQLLADAFECRVIIENLTSTAATAEPVGAKHAILASGSVEGIVGLSQLLNQRLGIQNISYFEYQPSKFVVTFDAAEIPTSLLDGFATSVNVKIDELRLTRAG